MKKLLYILAGICLASALGVGSAYLSYNIIVSRVAVEVPDLVGMDAEEAARMLADRNLKLTLESEEYDLDIPKGRIISQTIESGTHLSGEQEVGVVVSRGPSVRQIPLLTGMTLMEARQALSKDGLDFRLISVHSDTIEQDIIIAQRPRPEEWAGQAITVIASAGRHDIIYYCPTFLGYTMEEASALATALGLETEITATGQWARYVAEQSPAPGTSIRPGDVVHLKLRGEL